MEAQEGGAAPPPADPSPSTPLPNGATAAAGASKGVWAGGLGSAQAGNGAPSFADILVKLIKPPTISVLVHPPAATDAGKPAAFFSSDELRSSCKPLDYTIIAKTPGGRPPFQLIRNHLIQRFRFVGDFVISAFDERHLLLRFGNEDDYLKILLKESMAVQGRLFRFLKWDTDFAPEVDSPVVPVWMAMPRLPANYYLEPMLRSIAGSVGPVLQISEETLNMTKTHAAVVCVQLDVSKKLHDEVWIGVAAGGFWQKIQYINPPHYCTGCNRLGHIVSRCRQGVAAGSSKKEPNKAQQVFEEIPQRTGKEREAKNPPTTVDQPPVWRAVKNKRTAAARDQDGKVGETPPIGDISPRAPQPTMAAATELLHKNPFAALVELDDEEITSKKPSVGEADPSNDETRVLDQNLQGNNGQDDAAHVLDDLPQQGTEVGAEGEPAAASSSAHHAAQVDAAQVDVQMPQTGIDDPKVAPKAVGLVDDQVPLKIHKQKTRKGENKPPTSTEEDAILPPHDVGAEDQSVGTNAPSSSALPAAPRSGATHVFDEMPQQGAEGHSAEAEATNASAPLVPDEYPQKKAGKGKKKHQASAESPMVIIYPKAKSTDGVLKASIEDQVRVPLVEFSDPPLEFNPAAVLALAWRENLIQVEDSKYHAGVRNRAIIRSSSLGNLSKTDWQSPTPGTQQALQHASSVDDSQNVVNASVMQPADVLKNIVMEDKISENVECTNAHVHEDAVGDGPLSTLQIDHERTYIDALRTSQSPAEVVVKDLSSSSSVNRRMISRPSRKGGVRISLPIPRVRFPSPPTSAAPTQFNLEAARSVAEQASAENVLMPGFTFPLEESDDHDDVDSVDEDDERCRRRPGLRPRGVLRRNYSWDEFSLEF